VFLQRAFDPSGKSVFICNTQSTCVNVRVYNYIYIYIYLFMRIYIYMYMYKYVGVYICMYTYICMYVHVRYVYVQVYAYECMNTNTYILVCIFTHAYSELTVALKINNKKTYPPQIVLSPSCTNILATTRILPFPDPPLLADDLFFGWQANCTAR